MKYSKKCEYMYVLLTAQQTFLFAIVESTLSQPSESKYVGSNRSERLHACSCMDRDKTRANENKFFHLLVVLTRINMYVCQHKIFINLGN